MAEEEKKDKKLDTITGGGVAPKPATPATKTGKIELNEEQVLSLLKIVEDLQRKDVEKDEMIKKLTYAADKNRIEKYQNEKAGQNSIVPKCLISTWDKKVIMGSRMKPQEVFVDHAGVYHERQDVEMFLEGETDPVVVPYKDWFKRVEKIEAQIVGKKSDNSGHTIVTAEFKDGRQIDIDINFIN